MKTKRFDTDGNPTVHDSARRTPSNEEREGPIRGKGTMTALFLAIVVAAGCLSWATLTVLRPMDDPLNSTQFTTVPVQTGEVGSSLTLNTVAVWKPSPVGVNGAAGVVTGVQIGAGDEVAAGSVLYSVDLRPVVIATGAVPAFRPITQGTQGADVAQLQTLLTELGHFAGESTGEAGAGTAAAIRAWQKSANLQQTGVVELGDVIFVPSLPARISLDSDLVARGKTLAGGEEVVRGLPAAPLFTIPVTEAQASMIPTGTRVQITAPDDSMWEAVSTEQTVDPDTQTITIGLQGLDGGTVCEDACGLVPVTGEARLASVIVTMPTVTGLVTPSAALVTDASGQVSVLDDDGKRIPVTVVASARGMSVIEGVDEGVRVRVPAVAEESGQ